MPKKSQPAFVPNAPYVSRKGLPSGVALAISRWMLLGGFAAMILLPPVIQVVAELREGKPLSLLSFPNAAQGSIAARLRSFENRLEDESVVEQAMRHQYAEAAYKVFHEGNHKVLLGRDGFLHFRTDLDSIIGRDPTKPIPRTVTKETPEGKAWVSSRDAILDFATQLRARNIQLVLVPVPTKTTIYPDTLGIETDRALIHPLQDAIYDQLRGAGVDVLDLTQIFSTMRGKTPLYLKGDTHWTPEGMEVAAHEIATAIKTYKEFPGMAAASKPLTSELLPREVTNVGDMASQLGFPEGSPLAPAETVTARVVVDTATAKPVEDDPDSPIVLIGDSFSMVFSGEGTKFTWGADAGLPEHLMARLGTRIDVISGVGNGATGARKSLVEKHGSLEGKKMVIWLLAARLITLDEEAMRREVDQWEYVKIPATGSGTHGLSKATPAVDTASTGLPAGAVAKVRAKVTAIAKFPDPAVSRSPYPNMLTEVSFEVQETLAGQVADKSINVLFWAFKLNKLTGELPKVGDEMELTLTATVPPDAALEQRARAEPIVNDDGEEVIVMTYWPLETKRLAQP